MHSQHRSCTKDNNRGTTTCPGADPDADRCLQKCLSSVSAEQWGAEHVSESQDIQDKRASTQDLIQDKTGATGYWGNTTGLVIYWWDI
uniref:Uncharacterized protein n=1 Tax=Knipowitschia caucasica TaxID=637954 RepID=A0AAV2KRP6_KNICA